jgi:quercetin dioxygenase-like cupin family protein
MLHAHGHYQNLSESEIEAAVRREGFHPLLIADPPGTAYPPHRHPETKLLAFLRGSMELMIDGRRFDCSPGDRVIIPGDLFHAAIVGPEGCDFFWSEKLIRKGQD